MDLIGNPLKSTENIPPWIWICIWICGARRVWFP